MSRSIKIAFSGLVLVLVFVSVLFFSYQYKQSDQKQKNFHASMYYFDNKDFFAQSVASFKNVKPLAQPPHLFIVNQHILAAHVIAKQFALSADPKVTTVILITQNNWNVGRAPIITSNYEWKTPLGDIQPDTKIVDQLITSKIASAEDDIFTTEHGITGIVPYVANSFPNAKIVPLVIRDYAPNNLIDSLAAQLSTLDLSHTAIIGTIDMSHYLPKYVADIHDAITVQSIKEFDYDTLPKLDIDTVPTLRTVLKIAESKHLQSFVQTGHENSATIVGDPDLISTTSYISGYFAPGNSEEINGTVNLLFVGNTNFDKSVTQNIAMNGTDSIFKNIERLFLGTHAVFGIREASTTTVISLQEKNICIESFDSVENKNLISLANKIREDTIHCDTIIVSAKWNNIYSSSVTNQQTTVAHALIDAGANMLVGISPDMIQPIEIYKNKPIFYSLGNFVSSQNGSFENQHGLALNLQLGSTTNTFTLIPVEIKKGDVSFASVKDSNRIPPMVINKNLLSREIGSAILTTRQFTLINK